MGRNEKFLQKARWLAPTLFLREVRPVNGEALGRPLTMGAPLVLDYGQHLVGHLSLRFGFSGNHPDAPLYVRVRFAERLCELEERVEDYRGWVSAAWVQQEQLHLDVLPAAIRLERRYAFRYVQIELLAESERYQPTVEEAPAQAVTSADESVLQPLTVDDPDLKKLDEVACRTLRDCMQSVFEDGPKRDRRLWMGDLRLQALANYRTYRNHDLVKRCLYLFAGSTLENGQVAASLFVEPEIEADDMPMFDYSLLYLPALWDYWAATGDRETLEELWPTAWRQMELAGARLDGSGVVGDSDRLGWAFIDWNLALNKQAAAHGVYLYALGYGEKLARAVGDDRAAAFARQELTEKRQAARAQFYDESSGLFVSGTGRQISWASQIWMVLGGVVTGREALALLERTERCPDALKIVTPYLYHYYLEALLSLDQKERALAVLNDYWGGMLREGADSFWELYDPEDPNASPYGGSIVNSYCHAWSCAPAYFLRNETASYNRVAQNDGQNVEATEK